ncbi:MAG: LysM peptidoglycan-binding domain-containing protein [Gammaproteobacteria bacterium]|nr:LysM peptidoglycan-binding domain-containing protein [Gammaproteobacteria bacterium]
MKPKSIGVAILFALTIISVAVAGQKSEVVLAPDHPDQYVVKKGDTLWDIAETFLRDPWRWKDIWEGNSHINNPHLIYPGDVVYLSEKNGRPVLSMRDRSGDNGTNLSADGPEGSRVKVTPTIRQGKLSTPIPTIPMSIIRPFLSKPRVVDNDTLDDAPYVVSFQDGRLLGGTDSIVYVRGLNGEKNTDFDIVRKGKPYRHHETGKVLGYEALYVGKSQLLKNGDPATFHLLSSERDARIGDRLIHGGMEKGLFGIHPHVPETDLRGSIINVIDGVTQIGRHNVVVIDMGSKDGIEAGHVLSIFQSSDTVRDRIVNEAGEWIKLPEEKAGILMVFRSFDKVSFGLVMDATRALHVTDTVRTPPLY